MERRYLYKSGEVAQAVGLSRDQFNRTVRNGTFEAAEVKKWGKPAWTLEQVERLVEQSQRVPARGPCGLPKKDSYTSGDVCQVLGGISHERLRYLIEKGMILDCEIRDKNGHRVWTEADLQEVLGSER